MTALWNAIEAAAATRGRITTPWTATGVSIDTRTLAPGDIFVALKGPNFDGHDFCFEALEKGAAALLVDRIPIGLPAQAPILEVPDVMRGLTDLATTARARSAAKAIGVTGSVGKTGTKEALRLVLSRQGATHATEGNLNNHWGLPLTLARLPRDAAFAVLEMGMNHPGEITPLSVLARPHVAVITTVEAVHSAFFASTEQIADAKAEIFAGMATGGTAVLNRDNPHFERLAAAARAKGLAVLSFGTVPEADLRATDMILNGERSDVKAAVQGRPLDYRLGVPGRHWVINSLAVLGAVLAAGADVAAAAAALVDLAPAKGRGKRSAVTVEGGSFLLVDESYNASPASVAAALETLSRARPALGGRRIAVLGDMLELGADSAERHAGLLGPIQESGIDLVFTAGKEMGHLWEALPSALCGAHAPDSQALAPLVATALRPGDVVMVKGSAGSRMGVVVKALEALGKQANGKQEGR